MIAYTRAATCDDLEGILALQKENLQAALSLHEIDSQGFLTVAHKPAELAKLNGIEPHIIAKEAGAVVAYLLAMTVESQNDLAVLRPLFVLFQSLQYHGKAICQYRYIVVGQVCVGNNYRGRGILDACYAFYRQTFQPTYDFAITEIAAANLRSLRAHKRIGFDQIHQYTAPDGVEWVIVLWDWNYIKK